MGEDMSESNQPVPPVPHTPPAPVAPTGPPVVRKNWWGRNWKWFVPTGCLTLIVVVGGCIAGVLGLAFSLIKSSDTYKDALAATKASVVVQEALGTPIEAGWLVTGNIHVSGTSGNADLSIPISGPKDEAVIYAIAVKSAGKWKFTTLKVQVKSTGERLDLLAEE